MYWFPKVLFHFIACVKNVYGQSVCAAQLRFIPEMRSGENIAAKKLNMVLHNLLCV
jgi:hypothetical protein